MICFASGGRDPGLGFETLHRHHVVERAKGASVTDSRDNIPSDLAETLAQAPNLTVLARAGLTVAGTYEFTAPHIWTHESLAGFAYSTSVLSRSALGDHIEAFERDLRDRLHAVQPDGNFEESVSFAYDLALKP